MINKADAVVAEPKAAAPIARVSLTWLLLAQALVVLPFVQHVPISITLLWL
ncbi:transglutaminase, partial [Pseudomonas syringae pv. actinidiae ICMP 19096]